MGSQSSRMLLTPCRRWTSPSMRSSRKSTLARCACFSLMCSSIGRRPGTRPSPFPSANLTAPSSVRSCRPRTQSRSSRPRCAPLRKAKPSTSPCRCSGASPASGWAISTSTRRAGMCVRPPRCPLTTPALMRNIRRHKNALEGAIMGIARAVMAVSRFRGERSR